MPSEKKINYLVRILLIVGLFILLQGLMSAGILSRYSQGVLMVICINIILAVSLNITVGLLGQINLGHAGFMSIGAYTAGLFSQTHLLTGWTNLVVCILLAGLVSYLAGFIIGIPGLRLKGDYLAIITLAFGEIIRVLIEFFPFTGGAQGLVGLPTYKNFPFFFWITVISIAFLYSLFTSRYGRSILAIREDDIAAQSIGVNTTRAKIFAFAISACFAGIAGVLYCNYMGILNAQQFSFAYSIDILVMVVFGGMGSFTGSVLSAILLTLLPEFLRSFQDIRMILYALALIGIMIYHPKGLFGRKEISLIPLMNHFKKRGGANDVHHS